MKSLRGKLLLCIFLILVVTQSISIVWLWHESKEQIELMAQKAQTQNKHERKEIDDEIEEEIMEAIAALFLPATTSIGLTMLLIFIAVSYFTMPLKLLSSQIRQRTPYNLKPLQLGKSSSEISLVGQTVNQLLVRLDDGLENERRFTADVAHELRTPLAGIRLNLELMLQNGIDQAQPLIERIDQMMISIEQLLQLARAGQKLLEGHGERFDLIAEVITPSQNEWEEDPTSPYPLLIQTPEHAFMTGDSGLIYLMLRNLLENIRRYAPDGQQALIRVSITGHTLALEVLDEGPGVATEKIPLLTQRYTRLDKTIKGHGLGLNIVNRIIQVHNAQLNISNRNDRTGLHICVTFKT